MAKKSTNFNGGKKPIKGNHVLDLMKWVGMTDAEIRAAAAKQKPARPLPITDEATHAPPPNLITEAAALYEALEDVRESAWSDYAAGGCLSPSVQHYVARVTHAYMRAHDRWERRGGSYEDASACGDCCAACESPGHAIQACPDIRAALMGDA